MDIKSKNSEKNTTYAAFQIKIMRRFCINALISIVIVIGLYLFLWKRRIGDWIVSLIELLPGMDHFIYIMTIFVEKRKFFLQQQ